MKYVKMFGLLVIGAAAPMAFAGTASATITSPAGTAYTGNIQMTAPLVEFETGGNVKCHSVLEGSVTKGETTVPITKLVFSACGSDTFSVLKKGHMFIASNGTVSLSGTEYTKMLHRTIFGFPLTTHCILRLENTSIGTLTEGVSPAEVHFGSSVIPNVETDGECSDAVITGDYTVTTPSGAITVD